MSSRENTLRAVAQVLSEEALRDHQAHLELDEIIAYYEGTLPSAEEEQMRLHLALCSECAELALDFRTFPNIEPTSDFPPTTFADREADWEVLRSRLWPHTRTRSWIPHSLAALFFLTTLAVSVLLHQYREMHREFSQPRGADVISHLIPEEDPLLANDQEIVSRVPLQAAQHLIFLYLPEAPLTSEYLVEILGSANRDAEVLWTGELRPSTEGYIGLTMERDFLPSGSYRIRLSTLDGEMRPVANYLLKIEAE